MSDYLGAFFMGMVAGAVAVGIGVALVTSWEGPSYNDVICNTNGYYEAVEVAGQWFCTGPILNVPGLRQ